MRFGIIYFWLFIFEGGNIEVPFAGGPKLRLIIQRGKIILKDVTQMECGPHLVIGQATLGTEWLTWPQNVQNVVQTTSSLILHSLHIICVEVWV